MKFSKISCLVALLFASFTMMGQEQNEVVIDYNSPKKYIIAGVSVEGNQHLSAEKIIEPTGMRVGMEITVPGEDISSIIKRLWALRYLSDVSIKIDSLTAGRDSAYFKIEVTERPRVSVWDFKGVRSGEKKEIQERVNLRRGSEYSEYVSKTTSDIIKRYFAEKGFINATVTPEVTEEKNIKNAIRVTFNVDRGEKIKIQTINFIGNNKDVSDFKIAKQMKKTKSKKIYNFFNSKKFNEKEYENDKQNAISAFNEAGYRDARLVRDSIYYVEPNRLGIDLVFEQGNQYRFGDITWTGNSVYSTDVLNEVLAVSKGDIYDLVTMEKRLYGGDKDSEYAVSKLYRDNGYLFFNITPVEVSIQNDSVDVEMRISEGKQATLNNIVINGNDLTNERVVRRQIFTRPGYLFSQSDFERSIREIASLGQFDPESIMDGNKGYSVIPNQMNNTVDIIYNVTEKPSSQLELSGGWGGSTFVATAGVSFNNFSTKRMFDKGAWRPVPLGDAQNLSFRFQTNGTYYTSVSASFTEPWLFGKRPTSLSVSSYYQKQTNSNIYLNMLSNDKKFELYGFAASLGKRLKWPDSYFVLYNGFSWQTYKLTDWYSGYFIFDNGVSHNVSYSLTLSRNSSDQQIFPRQGSEFSASLQLTPPFSLLRKKDLGNLDANGDPVKVKSYKDINYDNWSSTDRYKWIEYHKWKLSGTTYVKLAGNLVLMGRAQFGYLGYYNRNWGYSPFEYFMVGGDGMSGYSTYGTDIVSMRGYKNYSLTPMVKTAYSSNGEGYAGNVYDKFTAELRFPVILEPNSTVYILGFLEAGNCWADIRQFNPFDIKRSAGVGVRIYLPMVGLLGIDYGYGFDDSENGNSQFHFVIGQQF